MKKLKKLANYLGVILLCLIVVELIIRAFLFFTLPVKTQKDKLFLYSQYYPNLTSLNTYSYDSTRHNILVLGGSVVYADTIPFYKDGELNLVSFCGFNNVNQEKYNVLNLAYPAHTTLDSKNKLKLLEDYHFDYVFIYHGINDARSNNVDSADFDASYRHIAFYDELALIEEHAELPYYLSAYMLELLTKRLLTYLGLKTYTPREFLEFLYGVNEEIESKYFNRSCAYYASDVFYNNLDFILEQSITRGWRPIIFTYAFFQPENYTLEKFYKSQLDYSTDFFPTELYGDPDCIPSIIEDHNLQIERLNSKYTLAIAFEDFNGKLDKNMTNFMDICHLTDKGCQEMYAIIDTLIEPQSTTGF